VKLRIILNAGTADDCKFSHACRQKERTYKYLGDELIE